MDVEMLLLGWALGGLTVLALTWLYPTDATVPGAGRPERSDGGRDRADTGPDQVVHPCTGEEVRLRRSERTLGLHVRPIDVEQE